MQPEQLHPAVIHFVIALFIVAYFADILFLLRKKEVFLHLARFNLYAAGVFVLMALITGIIAEENVKIPTEAAGTFEFHELFAFLTATFVLALVFWRLSINGQYPEKFKYLYLLVSSIGIVFLLLTSFYGGDLVYKHGIATKMNQIKTDQNSKQ